MFEKMTSLAVHKWPAVLALSVLFCVFGWTRFQSLPIEAFPDVTDPMVEVVGVFPGQAAEEVERRVTLELERALAGTPKLRDLRSVSVFGLALLTLTFEDGITDFERRALVAERLRDISLPAGAEAVMGPQATPVGQIYRYTMNGPRSLKELRALQDFVVERRLRSVPGVADVVTFGGYERQYQIRIDPMRLAATGVSLREVHEAISHANENAGGGYVEVGSQELVVRGLGAIVDPDDLGLAVVRSEGGVPVRVRDVADIVEGSTPRRGAVGRGRNDEVVEGIVLLRRGENPSVVLEALHERIDLLNREILPNDVHIDTFYDRTTLVNATLATVGKNMIEGALLVLALVYLFLRTARAMVIVAVVIPVSMLTAFVGLSAMGLPANLISLGAIDFGILVDGAIIVIESTLHQMDRASVPGESRADLVKRSAAMVAKPVVFSMLIIIVALGPIFALERVEGRIFAPMAFTYVFALLGALASAVFVVPALEAVLMRGTVNTSEPRWLHFLGGLYTRLLTALRPWRKAVIAGFTACVLSLGWFASGIGTEFLPELNEGGFYVTAVFPSAIALDETRLRVRDIRAKILETPEVRDVLSHVGRPESATQAEGPNNAELFVVLAPEKEWRPGRRRTDLEAELRRRLEEIPGVQYNFSQPITDRVFETISGVVGQVVVKVRGSDLPEMTRVAEQVRGRLARIDGITDLSLYQAGTIPSLRIDLDRDALARRGLTVEEVQHVIRIALGGEVATEVWQDERRFAVALRLPDEVRESAEALSRLVIDPQSGVTLGEIAHIDIGSGRAAIWRQDLTRFVAVKFNVRGRDLGSTVDEARKSVAALTLPQGTYATWSGEFQNQDRALHRLGLTLPIAMILVVGILFLNFKRWRPTLIIIGFLPVAIAGAVGGLRLLGENFSVSSAVGCIALLGQVVLAGVTLCGRIDAAREHGATDPLVEGARDAFRPVLLTTALALLGLLPAALSHAMGSETQRPFAIAIVAGLFIVTPALLLLLPLLYTTPHETTPHEPSPQPSLAAALTVVVMMTLAAPHSASAQDADPAQSPSTASTFTLDEALAVQRQGHPRLARARSLEAAAEHDIAAAGMWTNPELFVDYTAGVANSSYDRAGTGVFGVSQFVELSGAPRARRESARHLRDAARAEREGVERELAFEAESTFVALAAQQGIVDAAGELVRQLERAQRIVESRVSAGTMSRYAARRVEVARAEAVVALGGELAELAERRGAFDVAVGPLAANLAGRAVASAAPLALPPVEQLIERAFAERRDLAASTSRQRSAEADITVARRSVVPGFALRVFGGFGQGPGQWDVGAGVAVPLPVVDRGQAAIPAAESRAQAARESTEALNLEIGQRVRAAYSAAKLRFGALERFVQETSSSSEALAAEAEAQFREGRLSILELVDSITASNALVVRRLELTRDARLAEQSVRRLVEVGD